MGLLEPHGGYRRRHGEADLTGPEMKAFRTLDQADVKGKRVLVRVDLNVPMEDGRVTDATRIERVLPTLHEISDKGGKVILLAHFGRPKGRDPKESPAAGGGSAWTTARKSRVAFAEDCIGDVAAKAVAALEDGDVLLLENTRFHAGEEKNDPAFVQELAALGDLYVNDAFSPAHRAHASTEGLAHVLPSLCRPHHAGGARCADQGRSKHPARPLVAIVGGAKVSTKIDLLENLVTKVDALVIGGGMANTFLHAMGLAIGKSLAEKDLAATALDILEKARQTNCAIVLPVDGVCAYEFKARRLYTTPTGSTPSPDDQMILDVGLAIGRADECRHQ